MTQERATTPAAANRAMTPAEWGMLISLSLLWGGSFFFNGVAVRELPTLTIVVGRVALAALILLIVVFVRGRGVPLTASLAGAFLVMGFLNNVVPFTLIVWGQTQIASGLAAILNATTPLFGVLVAHLATTDERLTGGRIAGVLLGIAGVAVLFSGDIASAVSGSFWAQVACLGAALSYAFAGIYGRRFRAMGVPPLQTAAGQVTASALMLIPVVAIVDQPWTLPQPSLAAVGALLGVAALSTALAYVLYFRILATAGATNLLLVTLLIPASAILLGAAFLDEALAVRHLAGMALIACGLAAIDGRPVQWLSHRRPA